jgi:hypothetical protein
MVDTPTEQNMRLITRVSLGSERERDELLGKIKRKGNAEECATKIAAAFQ